MHDTQENPGSENAAADEETSHAIALPTTVSDLMLQKKSGVKKTLNDQLEVHFVTLWQEENFRKYLDAVYNEQAIEGNLLIDSSEAARMIRDKARKVGDGYIAGQKLGTLVRSMNVVMRRYNVGRIARRQG